MLNMSIADKPSTITLPAAAAPGATILDFLIRTFPHIPAEQWAARLLEGKVTDERGNTVTAETAFTPSKRIFYYREVQDEPVIPFADRILFQNDEILVADKPHFLPVVPGGRFVNECLLSRLRERTGIADLAPMHRLDRETAGLVLFSVNRNTRGLYHDLFMHGKAEKTYEALAMLERPPTERQWTVENRIARGEPRFRMKIVPGIVNARSVIHLVEVRGNRGRFRLHPITGKTHQLRLHMSSLGFGILNDRVYPALLPESEDVYERPLRLIARRLAFRDPMTGTTRTFESGCELPNPA